MRRLLFVLLACACTGSRQPGPTVFEAGDPAITVITTADLRGRTVLDALQMRVADIRVEQHARECPHISLRTARSLPTTGVVSIYVDGTIAKDTCIFAKFAPGEVERIEVYPGGITSRPGYARNDHGLILIFRRQY